MYRSRPARVGEKYVSHRFPSGSIGFIAPGDADTAVCMACDTKLKLVNLPIHLRPRLDVGEAVVTFAHIEGGPHHDGIRFANGDGVTLQQLGPNVEAYLVDALVEPQTDGGAGATRELETVE
jgi:hypothetical protein